MADEHRHSLLKEGVKLAPRKDKSRFGTFNHTNKGISSLLNVYNCVED